MWPGSKGRTTEGTLGRCSSTVANRARCSDGGGVSINFIKLAARVIARVVPETGYGDLELGFGPCNASKLFGYNIYGDEVLRKTTTYQ